MRMFDDDDDDDDVTVYEPIPWGARQRVMPRRTFRAAVSRVSKLSARGGSQARADRTPGLDRDDRAHAPGTVTRKRARRISAPVALHGDDPIALPAPPWPATAEPEPAESLIVHVSPLPSLISTLRATTSRLIADRFVLATSAAAPRPRSRFVDAFMQLALPISAALLVLSLSLGYYLASEPHGHRTISASLVPGPTVTAEPIVAPAIIEPHVHDPSVEPAIAMTSFESADLPAPVSHPVVSSHRPHAHGVATSSSRGGRPRRIVAGDTSTPLGSLRPHKAW